MKKIILLMLMVISVFCLSGCGSSLSENNFPRMYQSDLTKKTGEANTRLYNSNIDDVASFAKATELVAVSMDKKRHFAATFLYETSSGRVVSLSQIEGYLRYIGDEYRELLKADLTNAILDQLQDENLDVGDDGNIIATILSWEDSNDYYAICDFDGDGSWDYGSSSTLSFGSGTHQEEPYRQINEYEEIVLYSKDKIISLNNLEGGETLKDFKKML